MGNTEERLKGKAEEIKGAIKKGVGDVIGNEQMEAEGRVEQAEGQARQEAAKTAERVKGASEQVSGKIKGAIGSLTGDEQLEAEGKAEELKGKARKKAND